MTEDMIVLIASFLKQTKNKKYGPRPTQSLIFAMRHVAASYANHLDAEHFRELFFVLARFLPPNVLTIQFATIDTISFVLDTQYIRSQLTCDIDLAQFQRCMFEHLHIEKLTQPPDAQMVDEVADIDGSSRFISVVVQLLSTIICKSHILRKQTMFLLAEFIFKNELSQGWLFGLMSFAYYNRFVCSSK